MRKPYKNQRKNEKKRATSEYLKFSVDYFILIWYYMQAIKKL